MGTNAGHSQQTTGAAVQAALAREAGVRNSDISSPHSGHKPAGYGLPCAKCHLYYPADVDVCPTCKHNERVSPLAPKIAPRRADGTSEAIPDSTVLEHEREEFLKQFKAQMLEAHAEALDMPDTVCKFEEHHPGESAPADVCNGCYERLQERLDVCEAALHIDLKEAAQIVYDAVWADSSDPSKTYQNAASALLSELRKRAGITAILGPFQPLTH